MQKKLQRVPFRLRHKASRKSCRIGKEKKEEIETELEQVEEHLLARLEPQAFEHCEEAREADGESGEEEVEAHREGELDAGEQDCVGAVEHGRDL